MNQRKPATPAQPHNGPEIQETFLEIHGIDWEEGPVPIDELEEVNLTRNDVERRGEPFGITRRLTKDHELGFSAGRFVDEIENQVFQASGSRSRQECSVL